MRFLRIAIVALLVIVPALSSTPRSATVTPTMSRGSSAVVSTRPQSGAPSERIVSYGAWRPTGAPTGLTQAPSPTAALAGLGNAAESTVGAPLTIGPRNVHEPSSIHPAPSISEMTAAIASGLASWWSIGPGLYVALPGYRDGTTVHVKVCRGSACITAPVWTQCGCPGGRIVDLSADLFRRFAPLSLGLIVVTLERLP